MRLGDAEQLARTLVRALDPNVKPDTNLGAAGAARRARQHRVLNVAGSMVERQYGGTFAHTIVQSGCERCDARISRRRANEISSRLAGYADPLRATAAFCRMMGIAQVDDIKASESAHAEFCLTALQQLEPLVQGA
jgi:hypothetical protein